MVSRTMPTELGDSDREAADAQDAIDADLARRQRSQERAQLRAIIGSLRQVLQADEAHLNRLRYRERDIRLGPEEMMIRGGRRIKVRGQPNPDAADALQPEIIATEERVAKVRGELHMHEERLKDYQ